MTLFYLKLTVTPLLMWAISLASRRWGGLLGGLLSGLPITSALVITFLCLEQGPAFALGAIPGALGGLAAVQTTYTFYLLATRRLGIAASVLLALLCYGLAAYAFTHWGSLYLSIAVALALICVLIDASGREPTPDTLARPRHRYWEIPLRMVSATCLLMVITRLASWLGPATSGMLAPIPVIAWPLVVFAHVQGGRAAMAAMVRGNAIGAVGVIAFYLVLAGLLETLGMAITISLAMLCAVVLTVGLATVLRRR
ncbi:TPA: hypothetical protein ACHTCR_001632 [Pseudomonas putida]|jgi:hypothetical protein|uniref:Permeases of the major facilitator superfamily n=1 Tax=Pseudomonas putida (strain GB-1) TaxID=76869 RepID=B0KKK6_PSEPG|nr:MULTISPECIES: hypothetical protein [Pseudomonas]ABY97912.1 conserved hypothetical protein [Pseudomonas putida GB-1]APE98285.1 hypothetical protein BG030_09770 [Pseudomonas putida]MBP0709896.1 hypothetical protein [Pseudomonas sp. T34]MCE1002768.1 hypothetical protein [Pseudomonas sp. NMI1173_11]MCK2189343.1 hypothetical protein [Pseudomonas sp. MB04B]